MTGRKGGTIVIRGILFDLDGVLMDTDQYHFQAWKELAEELGLSFTREQGNRCRGVSRMESLEILLEGSGLELTREEKRELADRKNRRYRELLSGLTPEDVSAEVHLILPELRRRGYRLGLASASRNAGLILERTGLGQWLDGVADGTCVTHSKPDPEVFLVAAHRIGVDPTKCAAVDDALAGIEAAHRAGMVGIAIGDSAVHQAGEYNLTSLKQLLELFLPQEETK